MTTILGPTPLPTSPEPGGTTVVVEPTPDPELVALRAYREDVRRVRSQPGHVTKSELDAIESTYQERLTT